MNQFSRSELLFDQSGMQNLLQARVAVFGIGGVGGMIAEALVRGGIGAIDLFDNDVISLTNLNRQIIALHSTLGRDKAEVMKERLLDINPDVQVNAVKLFYLPETADQVDLSLYDYVADAVDTVKAKLELASRAWQLRVPIICAMGAGNKLDITKLTVSDIYKTSVCPLARVMRNRLRKLGIPELKIVYSTEQPIKAMTSQDLSVDPIERSSGTAEDKNSARRAIPGSSSFVPPMMGLIIAGEILREIAKPAQNLTAPAVPPGR